MAAIRRKLRRQLPGARAAAHDAPSPADKGKGKKPQQPYAEYAYELMRDWLIRASDGTYYLRTDKVNDPGWMLSCSAARICCAVCWTLTHPALSAGVQKTIDMAFEYAEKSVLMKYDVPRKLVRSTINTWVVQSRSIWLHGICVGAAACVMVFAARAACEIMSAAGCMCLVYMHVFDAAAGTCG